MRPERFSTDNPRSNDVNGSTDNIVLSLDNISKRFGSVLAVASASLSLAMGEIHGLIGHNGSGKSTIVKLIDGLYPPDGGRMTGGGGKLLRTRLNQAHIGIATLHQDLALVSTMSVMDNFLIKPTTLQLASAGRRSQVLRPRRNREFVIEKLAGVGVDVDVDKPLGTISPTDQVLVAIARVLTELECSISSTKHGRAVERCPSVLVLDEPTSRLSYDGANQLFKGLELLVRQENLAVLLVTHHVSDVIEICDKCTVMRNGISLGTYQVAGLSRAEIAAMMAGVDTAYMETIGGHSRVPETEVTGQRDERDRSVTRVGGLDKLFHTTDTQYALAVHDLVGGAVKGVSFNVDTGEILGLTGLPGSGYDEIGYYVSGSRKAESGGVWVRGRRFDGRTPSSLQDRGGVFIPADRTRTSAIPKATVRENMSLGSERDFRRFVTLRKKQEIEELSAILEKLGMSADYLDRPLVQLSGGQQQKVIISRCLRKRWDCILLEEPAVAVDVGARGVILSSLRRIADSGSGIVYMSGQVEELTEVCDRIIVFSGGKIAGELGAGEMAESAILAYASLA